MNEPKGNTDEPPVNDWPEADEFELCSECGMFPCACDHDLMGELP